MELVYWNVNSLSLFWFSACNVNLKRWKEVSFKTTVVALKKHLTSKKGLLYYSPVKFICPGWNFLGGCVGESKRPDFLAIRYELKRWTKGENAGRMCAQWVRVLLFFTLIWSKRKECQNGPTYLLIELNTNRAGAGTFKEVVLSKVKSWK